MHKVSSHSRSSGGFGAWREVISRWMEGCLSGGRSRGWPNTFWLGGDKSKSSAQSRKRQQDPKSKEES
jgi:hypothetical protein